MINTRFAFNISGFGNPAVAIPVLHECGATCSLKSTPNN